MLLWSRCYCLRATERMAQLFLEGWGFKNEALFLRLGLPFTLIRLENGALFLRLDLPFTLIRHENGAFRSSNFRDLRFRVDQQHFENVAFHVDCKTYLKYRCGTFLDCPKSSLCAASVAVASSSQVDASTSFCCKLSRPCSVRWSSWARARKYTMTWCLAGRPFDKTGGNTDWKSSKRGDYQSGVASKLQIFIGIANECYTLSIRVSVTISLSKPSKYSYCTTKAMK